MLVDDRAPEVLGQRISTLLADAPTENYLQALVEDLTWERSTDTLEAVLRSLARG